MTESLKTPAISTTCPVCVGSGVFTYRYPDGPRAVTFTGNCEFCIGYYGGGDPKTRCTQERITSYIHPVVRAVHNFPVPLMHVRECQDTADLYGCGYMLEETGLDDSPLWSPLQVLKALAYWVDWESMRSEHSLNYRWGEDTDRELVYYKRIEAAIDGFDELVAATTTDAQAQTILESHEALLGEKADQYVRRDRRLDPQYPNPRFTAIFADQPERKEYLAKLLRDALEKAPAQTYQSMLFNWAKMAKKENINPQAIELLQWIMVNSDIEKNECMAPVRTILPEYLQLMARAISAQTLPTGERVDVRLVPCIDLHPHNLERLTKDSTEGPGREINFTLAKILNAFGVYGCTPLEALRISIRDILGKDRSIGFFDIQATLALFDELAEPAGDYIEFLPEALLHWPTNHNSLDTCEHIQGVMASHGLRCSKTSLIKDSGPSWEITVWNGEHKLNHGTPTQTAEWIIRMTRSRGRK